MREIVNILTFVIALALLGCTESSVTNNNQQTPETISEVEKSSGDWCCLDYTAHELDGTYTEVSNQAVCRNELREFRIQWTGDRPNYLNWYISDDDNHNPDASHLHRSQKDILLDGGIAGYGLGDQFVLTAEAYDDPDDIPQRYGNVISVIDCSNDGDVCPDPDESYNEQTGQCEDDQDTGLGSS